MITTSHRVKAEYFVEPWFQRRREELQEEPGRIHRKIWEFAVIAETFGLLNTCPECLGLELCADCTMLGRSRLEGSKVLGFGVGREPLPYWFYHQGCYVMATDAPLDIVQADWLQSGQHAASLKQLRQLNQSTDSDGRLFYRPVDMNHIPSDLLLGNFDFIYSAGSFEHLGGLDAGIYFFLRSMAALKPGGIACHTTEYNPLSDRETLNGEGLCIYRKQDLEKLSIMLQDQGDELYPLDLSGGDLDEDLYIDRIPYHGIPSHLSLYIGPHVTTSIVLIARRGGVK